MLNGFKYNDLVRNLYHVFLSEVVFIIRPSTGRNLSPREKNIIYKYINIFSILVGGFNPLEKY